MPWFISQDTSHRQWWDFSHPLLMDDSWGIIRDKQWVVLAGYSEIAQRFGTPPAALLPGGVSVCATRSLALRAQSCKCFRWLEESNRGLRFRLKDAAYLCSQEVINAPPIYQETRTEEWNKWLHGRCAHAGLLYCHQSSCFYTQMGGWPPADRMGCQHSSLEEESPLCTLSPGGDNLNGDPQITPCLFHELGLLLTHHFPLSTSLWGQWILFLAQGALVRVDSEVCPPWPCFCAWNC